MQVYDIQISSATDVERINAQGDYIYYSSGSAGGSSPCVEVRGINTGFRVKLLPGQGMRLPMGKVERDWMIKPNAAIAGSLIGAVVIGEGEIFDNRVTGYVEIVDGGKNKTIAGQVFGQRVSFGPVAGSWNSSQIWNPLGSGKRLIVKSYSCIGGASISGWNTSAIGVVSGAIGNKVSGGPGSVFESRGMQVASANVPGFVIVNAIPAGVQVTEPEPIVINPGFGFVLVTDGNTVSTVHTAHFVEEPV